MTNPLNRSCFRKKKMFGSSKKMQDPIKLAAEMFGNNDFRSKHSYLQRFIAICLLLNFLKIEKIWPAHFKLNI